MSTPTPNQAEKWYQEQVVAVLYGNIKGAILGSTINIALVTFVLWSIFNSSSICSDKLTPIPFTAVKPMTIRLLPGMDTPEIRSMIMRD